MQVFCITEKDSCILPQVVILQVRKRVIVYYLCVTENDEPFICLCILADNNV